MAAVLRAGSWAVNRKGPKRLMRMMGIEGDLPEAQHQQGAPDQQDLSIFVARSDHRPAEPGVVRGHHIYPDGKGFVYLAAVMDWFSRRVLSWRVSITMETDFCVEALREATELHGHPEIFNTDQRVQFTTPRSSTN